MTVLRRTLEKAPLTVEVVEDDMGEWRLRGRGGGAAGTGKGRGRGGGRKTGAGREVLNEVAVDEDGYAERGVGAAVRGRTSNDMQKASGWHDSGDDCACTSPDFYPAAPPGPSLSDKFQPQLSV